MRPRDVTVAGTRQRHDLSGQASVDSPIGVMEGAILGLAYDDMKPPERPKAF
jgi:hypothetical protein